MRSQKGVTIIEAIISIAIISAIFSISAVGAFQISKRLNVSPADTGLINIFSVAARHARDGVQGEGWGVYLPYNETTRVLNEIIIFKGSDYATRDTSFDLEYSFSEAVEFSNVSLSGASPSTGDDHEVTFTIFTGGTDDYGTITLEVYGEERVVAVTQDGFAVREY